MMPCFIKGYRISIYKSINSYNSNINNYYNQDNINYFYNRVKYQSLLLQTVESNDNIQIHNNHQIHNNNNNNNINKVRNILLIQIDECWHKIRRLIPKEILILFEDELLDFISLVVLATLRRSAEEYKTSRYLITEMLREADVNSDGKLSYSEWYRWLRNTSSIRDNNDDDGHNRDRSNDDDNDNNHPGDSSYKSHINQDIFNSNDNNDDLSSDPMIISLRSVFDHALSTLTIITRISNDPHILLTSFIAGCIAAGVLDDNICKRIMTKMSPTAW